MLLQTVLMLGLFSVSVSGYSTGAADAACTTLEPEHYGKVAQTTESPFYITVYVEKYTKGTPVEVKVDGEDEFQGFLLQARRLQGDTVTPVGTWQTPETDIAQLKICTNEADSVTHINKEPKYGLQFSWVPPDEDAGPIEFVVTVARTYDFYWKGIKSSVLESDYPAVSTTTNTPIEDGTSNSNPTCVASRFGLVVLLSIWLFKSLL